jgi:YesN/AraC family two-component response regulator
MKHRILISDDEKNTREGLKWSLESPEREIDVAADGHEAWKLFHQHHYDLIITDLKMPGIDGLELLNILN